MRTRITVVLSLLLLALMATPQMTAAPGGINSAGNLGCSCHGGASPDTTVVVDGLPEIYNASETYTFTVTVVNDVMVLDGDGVVTDGARTVPYGGFRILVSHGEVNTVPDELSHIMDDGLTHTAEGNMVRSWTMEWTAPAADDLNVEMTVFGNAVNGNAGGGGGSSGDYWNVANVMIPGMNAGAVAPSASALVIFITSIGLAVALIFAGVLWTFYRASPETFTIARFWGFLKPWLTTTDHKEVGIMYFLFGFFFFLVGGLLALLFRIQLAIPENDFLTYDEYNSFFTLHGTTMIFLAAMPMIAGFMNYVLPLQIGAKDLAFPRINAMGLWLLVFSAPLIFTGIWSGEAADISWVMYPPYSSLTESNLGSTLADYGSNPGTTAFISGMIMLGASSTLGGVNFITTVFTMRAPGVTWMKMPLFSWSVFISVFMLFMSLPAFIIGVAFLLFDHTIGTQFFVAGGDPLLFQHLFWFFGHPEVYVVIVPAFGIVSEVLATSARRSIFGYKSMVFAMAGIGIVGFVVWGHHMLTSGMDPFWRALFMIMTMLVAIPTGAKIFNWLATLWGGSLVMKTHTLWSLGFLVTFTLGGISGMFFPVAGLDIHFHDSYFVVAHFHYVFIGGTVFALFSAVYYWYPKATGRKLNETLGLWHFLIGFASYNAAFWPMHALGIMGMPRRTHSYTIESGFAEYNAAVSTFAFIFGLSQLLLLWNILYSARRGEEVGNDPWGGWSLEWSTTSPPPTPSFHDIPVQRDMNDHYSHHDKSELPGLKKRLWDATPSGGAEE